MTLTIRSFQRALAARKNMALTAGDCVSLANTEAKDILDSLYLGLECEITTCADFDEEDSTIDEFIALCKPLLQELSGKGKRHISLSVSPHQHLSLTEKNGDIHIELDGHHATITELTFQNLYQNLIKDIRNNPNLYGDSLATFANFLEQRPTTPADFLPVH